MKVSCQHFDHTPDLNRFGRTDIEVAMRPCDEKSLESLRDVEGVKEISTASAIDAKRGSRASQCVDQRGDESFSIFT